MIKSFASSLTVAGSALLLASLVPACGSNSAPPNGFQTNNPNNNNNNNGDGGNNDNNNGDGGPSHPLNSADGGQPVDLSDAGCATATATASKQPVYIEFILDGSGSMGSNNKWTAATGAITGVFQSMETAADDGVGAGLIVFSDSKDKTSGSGPYPETNVDVPIAFVDATQDSALVARVSGSPSNGTPTGTAMTGGYTVLTNFNPSAPLLPGGKKVLVLITDGCPSFDDACATAGDGSDNYATNACPVMAASNLAKAGGPIETFVIGVGTLPGDFSNYDPYFLAAVAQAGGTAPAGCNPKENAKGATDFCFFQVDPSGTSTATQTAFETALNAIRGQIASCTFALNATDAGTIDPNKVNVNVNGTPIFLDPTNGWSFTPGSNQTSITLNGTSCDTVKTTPNSSVSIVLGCVTQTPPPAK